MLAIAALVALAPLAHAENWPSFRGPTGMGVTTDRGLPTTWDGKSGKNVLWRAPLRPTVADAKPDLNQSSPIVWEDRVIVATVYWPKDREQKETPEQHVTCYAAGDGSELWDAVVPPGPWRLTDLRGGYGAPTPATDGQRIYVAFGSATLAALDMNGKPLWQRDVENHASIDVAMASSPVVFDSRVILLSDKNNKHSTLTAYDGKTGEVAWSQPRPNVAFNHSTPTLATVDGKPRMFVAASSALQAIDPTNGKVVWSCATPGDVTSPIVHDGQVYCDSGRGGPGVCVATGGSGDVTETHIRWRIGNVPEALSSPVVAGGMLFRTHNPGVLKCVDWKNGKQVFSARLGGVSTQTSPIVTADNLVFFAGGGRSVVIKPGESLDVLATNELDDPSAASPAVSQGRIFIKGGRYLYCIGEK